MAFQFISNNFVFFEVEKIFNELNCILLNKYALNIVLSELFFKRLVIQNLYAKNVLSAEVTLFLHDYMDLDLFFSNNIVVG